MTSKLTREELLNIIETDHVQCGEASALARIALAAMDSEPVAYMTYKGYLLHAGDPKLAEYSEPMPLYADPRLEPESAEPVAYMYDGEDGREYNGHNEFSGGGKGVPLYRHAQTATVTQQEQMFGIGSIFKSQRVSEQEADCDDCVYCQPQICHGEGCPAISEKPAQLAPVAGADLLHAAASAIEDLLTTKDRTGAGVWFDLPAKLRRAAMLNGGKS